VKGLLNGFDIDCNAFYYELKKTKASRHGEAAELLDVVMETMTEMSLPFLPSKNVEKEANHVVQPMKVKEKLSRQLIHVCGMHHFPLSLLSSFSWSYHHSSAAPMNH
jgi:hypothetical protein